MIGVHSFTPVLDGVERPMQAGILFAASSTFGRTMTVDTRNPGIAGRLSPLALVNEPGHNRTDPIRQDVTRYYILSRVNSMTMQRARAAAAAGKGAGPASSITKLARSVATRINRDVGPAILGAGGMLAGPDAPYGGAVAHATVQAPSTSIAGGTDEIQHNIIGERVPSGGKET